MWYPRGLMQLYYNFLAKQIIKTELPGLLAQLRELRLELPRNEDRMRPSEKPQVNDMALPCPYPSPQGGVKACRGGSRFRGNQGEGRPHPKRQQTTGPGEGLILGA